MQAAGRGSRQEQGGDARMHMQWPACHPDDGSNTTTCPPRYAYSSQGMGGQPPLPHHQGSKEPSGQHPQPQYLPHFTQNQPLHLPSGGQDVIRPMEMHGNYVGSIVYPVCSSSFVPSGVVVSQPPPTSHGGFIFRGTPRYDACRQQTTLFQSRGGAIKKSSHVACESGYRGTGRGQQSPVYHKPETPRTAGSYESGLATGALGQESRWVFTEGPQCMVHSSAALDVHNQSMMSHSHAAAETATPTAAVYEGTPYAVRTPEVRTMPMHIQEVQRRAEKGHQTFPRTRESQPSPLEQPALQAARPCFPPAYMPPDDRFLAGQHPSRSYFSPLTTSHPTVTPAPQWVGALMPQTFPSASWPNTQYILSNPSPLTTSQPTFTPAPQWDGALMPQTSPSASWSNTQYIPSISAESSHYSSPSPQTGYDVIHQTKHNRPHSVSMEMSLRTTSGEAGHYRLDSTHLLSTPSPFENNQKRKKAMDHVRPYSLLVQCVYIPYQ